MTQTPVERIRTLLARGDNVLRTQGRADDEQARAARARRAWEEAREVARDPDVPGPVRDLVEHRLAALPEPANG